MKLLKYVPNILTSMRLVLTFIYLILLHALNGNNKLYFTAALIIFILICLTDFLDGKIARATKAASPFGALLDVAADFVYIFSSLIMLSVNNMIPMWFIALVLGKFIEFLVTSYFIKKYESKSNSLFIFDYFGRIAAMNFFLIPGISLFVYADLDIMYINILLYITLILVVISSLVRCANCYKVIKLKRLVYNCDGTTFDKSL